MLRLLEVLSSGFDGVGLGKGKIGRWCGKLDQLATICSQLSQVEEWVRQVTPRMGAGLLVHTLVGEGLGV